LSFGAQGAIRWAAVLDDQVTAKLGTIRTGFTQTRTATATYGSTLDALGNNFKKTSGAAQDMIVKQTTLRERLTTVGTAFKEHTLAVAATASSIISLVENYTSLQKAQLLAQRSAVMQEKAQRTLTNAQDALQKAIAKYGANSKEAAKATNNVRIAQSSLAVAQERNRLNQERLNEAMANFGTNILPNIILAGGGVAELLGTLSKAGGGLTGIMTKLSGVIPALGTGIGGLTGLSGKAGTAITGLGGSIKNLGGFALAAAGPLAAIAGIIEDLRIGKDIFTRIFTPSPEAVGRLKQISANLKDMEDIPISGELVKLFDTITGATPKMDAAANSAKNLGTETKNLGNIWDHAAGSGVGAADATNQIGKAAASQTANIARLKQQFLGLDDSVNVYVKSVVDAQKAANLKEFDVLLSHGFVPPPLDQKVWHSTLSGATDDLGKLAASTKNFGTRYGEVGDTLAKVFPNWQADSKAAIDNFNANHQAAAGMTELETATASGHDKFLQFISTTEDGVVAAKTYHDQLAAWVAQELKIPNAMQMSTAELELQWKAAKGDTAAIAELNTRFKELQQSIAQGTKEFSVGFKIKDNADKFLKELIDNIDKKARKGIKVALQLKADIPAWNKTFTDAIDAASQLSDSQADAIAKGIIKTIDEKFKGSKGQFAGLRAQLQEAIADPKTPDKLRQLLANMQALDIPTNLLPPPSPAWTKNPSNWIDMSGPGWQKALGGGGGGSALSIPTALEAPDTTAFDSGLKTATTNGQTAASNITKNLANTTLAAPDPKPFAQGLNSALKSSTSTAKAITKALAKTEIQAPDPKPFAQGLNSALKAASKTASAITKALSKTKVGAPDLSDFGKGLNEAINAAGDAARRINAKLASIKIPQSTGGIWSFAKGGLVSAQSGAISTVHGPTRVGSFLAGDNPGGNETVAFIPHNSPGHIMQMLEQMFGGGSSKGGGVGGVVVNVSIPIDGNEIVPTRTLYKQVRANMGKNLWTHGQ
jgi:hypothetical protein